MRIRSSRRERRPKGEGRGLLRASCVLLSAFVAVDVAMAVAGLAGGVGAVLEGDAVESALRVLDMLVNLACAAAEAVLVKRAATVVRRSRSDTHDYVADSQLIAIVLFGMCVVSWCLEMLVLDGPKPLYTVSMVCETVPAVLYYRAIGREGHSRFWTGLRAPGSEAPLQASLPSERLSIDDATGLARPAAPGEDPCIEVMDWKGFSARHEGDPFLRRAERLVSPVANTTAYPADDALFGTLLIPEDELEVTGLAIKGRVSLAFCLTGGSLALIAEGEAARTFIAWCLGSQYLRKSSPAEFLYEMADLAVGDDAAVFASLDDRLDQLEDSVSESVTEVPRDFLGYVSDLRKQLASAERFYRQLAGAARASAGAACVGEPARRLFLDLQARSESLGYDALDLRDHVQQIKEGYQERINVRQNRAMSVLAIVTALSAPITIAAGWYGMNFDDMPELHAENAYGILACALVAVVTAEVVLFKRKHWF